MSLLPLRSFERLARIAAPFVLAVAVWVAVSPVFADLSRYGGHDWDEQTTHRLFTVLALREFGQLPLWMPYGCGGYSEWGNVQGATVLVSPWLPSYWWLDLRLALRLELLGMTAFAAVGAWLLAGRFTRSAGARLFVAAVFALNGRFALQAAVGHAWHLQYGYLPWVLWGYELALERGVRSRGTLVAAVFLALMVYGGAIYPLPHAAVLLGCYALGRSLLERRPTPIVRLAAIGGVAAGLAAPKLVPIALDFGARPRLIDSKEWMDLGMFVTALTARGQSVARAPVRVPQWGWHEYGMYVGWVPFLLLLVACAARADGKALAWKAAGLLAVLLGFGAFHELSPWSLLHQVSLFRSQHVPSRWLFSAALMLALVAAAVAERLLERAGRRRPLFEAAALAVAAFIAFDLATQAERPLSTAFWMEPRRIEREPEFKQYERVPPHLQYRRRDYGPEALPATWAGVGVIDCTLHASLNRWAPRAPDGRPFGLGARGVESPDYRGEAFLESGIGSARLVKFTPNELEVEVTGARVGDRIVVNQNYDPGWRAGDAPALDVRSNIAAVVERSEGRVRFRFWPRGLTAGLALGAATLLGLVIFIVRTRGTTRSD